MRVIERRVFVGVCGGMVVATVVVLLLHRQPIQCVLVVCACLLVVVHANPMFPVVCALRGKCRRKSVLSQYGTLLMGERIALGRCVCVCVLLTTGAAPKSECPRRGVVRPTETTEEGERGGSAGVRERGEGGRDLMLLPLPSFPSLLPLSSPPRLQPSGVWGFSCSLPAAFRESLL